jgi:hypothetical protein
MTPCLGLLFSVIAQRQKQVQTQASASLDSGACFFSPCVRRARLLLSSGPSMRGLLKQLPVRLGDDCDRTVDHGDRGLIINRINRNR